MALAARLTGRLPEVAAQIGFAAVVLFLLVAVGQPIVTDDLWWHLALGEAWLGGGPWLADDPLLYTAVSPPPPASWLSDIALFAIERSLGFSGLRVAHVAGVTGTLVLAWSLLRRASDLRMRNADLASKCVDFL